MARTSHIVGMRGKTTALLGAVLLLAATAFAASKGAERPAAAAAKATSAPERAARTDFPVKVPNADGSVTAVFQGEAPPADLKVPLVFGTTGLFFTFEGEKTAYRFEPKGELNFSDWTFDVFSPDGKRVLLLQDRFGPYHVVRVDRLKAYLQGKAAPDEVVLAPVKAGEAALVHANARWVSPTEFTYEVGGETTETRKASVKQN